MKFRSHPNVDFLMLVITVLAIWTAALLNDSAHKKVKKIYSAATTMTSRK